MSQHPYENWMGSCSAVKSLTPAEFCWPGTHDTGAYQKPDFNPVCSKDSIATSRLRFTRPFQAVASRWTVSQPGCDIYTQLMNGVRFLDLRVAFTQYRGKGQYYLVHTFACCKLEVAISDIKRFVMAHPTEMVFLGVEPYFGCDDQKLQGVFEAELGQFMYANKHGNSSFEKSETIECILQSQKRVIGMYRLQHPTTAASKNWFSEAELQYSYPFHGKDTVAKKQDYLIKSLQEYQDKKLGPGKMFMLPYTLTEDTMDVAEGIFRGDSLVTLADRMNPTLPDFISVRLSQEQRRVINIITVDHQDHSKLISICSLLNQERVSPTPASLDLFKTEEPTMERPRSSGSSRSSRSSVRSLVRLCCCSVEEEEEEEPEKKPL